MLAQEARLTGEVIDSIVRVERATEYFTGERPTDDVEFGEFVAHVSELPDVLRANLHSRERRVIWSSDPTLIGRQFADNDELERALLLESLETTQWNVSRAARLLGVSRDTMRYRIEKFRLAPPR